MDTSILQDIKRMIGADPECTEFDVDIIANINECFAILYQLGVGPTKPFMIKDETETWQDFIPNAVENYEGFIGMLKLYIKNRVQLEFDPPASSYVADAMKKSNEEREWRLRLEFDGIKYSDKINAELNK